MTRWWAAFIGNKQVNGRALLILILALVVGLGGTYLVHGFQVRRNAGGLLEQAGVTEADGDKIQAIMYLEQYLGLMPGDGAAMAKLALLLSQETKSLRAQGRAYLLYDELLRREEGGAADRLLFRREAAKLALRPGPFGLRRYAEAKQQLDELVKESGTDAETLQLQGQAEIGLGNYAEAMAYYKKAMEKTPSPAIRMDYATLLRELLHEPAEADKEIEKMVENENTPQVRFAAARYYHDAGQPAKAWEQLKVSADSASPSEEVLQLAGEVALALDKGAEARKLFERGLRLFPKNQRLSCDLALIEVHGGDIPKALALLEPLLRDPPKDIIDLWNLADLLIDVKELEKAKRVMEKIPRTAGGALVDYLEARLLMEKGAWGKAAASLEVARNDPRFGKYLGRRANLMLAQCDEHLLNADQRLKALRRAVEAGSADSTAFSAGRELALAQAAAGEIEPALARLRQLAFVSKPAAQRAQINEDIIRLLIVRNRALPPDKRAWREATERLFGDAMLVARSIGSAGSQLSVSACPIGVTLLLERIDPTTKNSRPRLLFAEVLFLQGKVDEARAQVEAEHAQDPNQVEPWLYLISLEEVKGGVAAAGVVLDQAERQLKNQVEWPLMRAQLLLKQGPEEARKRLPKLLESVERFQGADRDQLLTGLAEALSVVGDMPETWRRWRELAARKPHGLQVCFTLFEAALQANERDEAERVLKEELQKIEGAEGAFSTYAEGALRVAKVQAGNKADWTKTLADAHVYLARAAALRPSWSRVPLFEAAAFEMEGQKLKAIEKYRAAIERGERRLSVIKHVLVLMREQHMDAEGKTLLSSLGESVWSTPELSKLVGATLVNTGAPDRALELALKAAKGSTNVDDYVWLAAVARAAARSVAGEERVKRWAVAEKAYRDACGLNKTDPANWMDLIDLLVESGQKKQAEEALEQAAQSLGKEKAALVLARGADLLDQVKTADDRFKKLLAERPNDPRVLRAAAGFFIKRGNLPMADETLRALLAPGAQATAGDAAWARLYRALVLALQGGQDRFHDANNLLEQAGPEEQQTEEYRAVKAQICALQPSRRGEAVKIIEGLAKQAPLSEGLRFILAQLYEADPGQGRRADAEAQLAILAREHKENATYLDHYVSILLLQGKTSEAAVWLEKLRALKPEATRTKELDIELLLIGKTKDKNRVINLVDDYIHDKDARLDRAGAWFESLGQPDKAEAAYREFAKSSKQPASMLPLALHLAKNNKTAEALAICERAWAKAPPEAVARATVAVVAAGPADAAQLKAAERSLRAAIETAPELKALPFYLAEFYDYQDRPDEAISIYKVLIERNPHSVAALNNLAYLLALARDETEQALTLVNEAIALDRSNAELLDTRALIYLKQNKAVPALGDLRDASTRKPSPAIHFHLARARLMAGDKAGAVEAWNNALQAGLNESALSPLERPDFRSLRDELK